jgi:hypothetical protein
MKVMLAKHGGLFAGIVRPPQCVDATALPKPQAKVLKRLVADTVASPSMETQALGKARDAMSYTITVEDGNRSTVLHQSDATMSEKFAVLLEWLEQHATKQ